MGNDPIRKKKHVQVRHFLHVSFLSNLPRIKGPIEIDVFLRPPSCGRRLLGIGGSPCSCGNHAHSSNSIPSQLLARSLATNTYVCRHDIEYVRPVVPPITWWRGLSLYKTSRSFCQQKPMWLINNMGYWLWKDMLQNLAQGETIPCITA